MTSATKGFGISMAVTLGPTRQRVELFPLNLINIQQFESAVIVGRWLVLTVWSDDCLVPSEPLFAPRIFTPSVITQTPSISITM